MPGNQFYLGRQPIVGRKGELVAYELLFRASNVNMATLADPVAASAAVIQYAFSELGMPTALGDKRGFINVTEALLMSEVLEAIPKDAVTLEILETVEITDAVVERCRNLKNAGFVLALDDVTSLDEAKRGILPYIEVVKLDVLALAVPEIISLTQQLKTYRGVLLAEKVETREMFELCRELGFDLFQGYFFARPVIITGRSVQPSVLALLKLYSLIIADAEIEELEAALKRSPDLTMRLLKLVNSAALHLSQKVSSVRTAIMMIGRAQLGRLVQILMFAQQSSRGAVADPLLQTAMVRGRLMEGIAQSLSRADLRDRAFMVGMLSVVDALFGQRLEVIISLLNLDDSVQAALLARDGELGALLRLVEATETADSGLAGKMMRQLGFEGFDAMNRLQVEAMKWAVNF